MDPTNSVKKLLKKEKYPMLQNLYEVNMRILGKLHIYLKLVDESVSAYGNSVG